MIGIGCLAGYVWLFFSYSQPQGHVVEACLIKNITGFACPSCGSTRAILQLMKGDIQGSLAINPLGLLLAIIMCLAPLWMLFDLLFKRSHLFFFYICVERCLKMRGIALFSGCLILGNWIWNIAKGL